MFVVDEDYIGKTKISLYTRFHQHQLTVRRCDDLSELFSHGLNENHIMDWWGRAPRLHRISKAGCGLIESRRSEVNALNLYIELQATWRNLQQFDQYVHSRSADYYRSFQYSWENNKSNQLSAHMTEKWQICQFNADLQEQITTKPMKKIIKFWKLL